MTTQRPLTDAELDALEAAAEAATPGDWVAGRTVIGGSGKVRAYVYSDDRAVRATIDGSASRHDEIEADGRHLALANPATVLRLIAELRELRRGAEDAKLAAVIATIRVIADAQRGDFGGDGDEEQEP